MPTPPNGRTIHHVPDPRPGPPPQTKTADYDATTSGGVMDVAYVNHYDGETEIVHREYEWDPIQERWQKTQPSVWQRIYTPADPPTVPETGTYRVLDGTIQRETGAYSTT